MTEVADGKEQKQYGKIERNGVNEEDMGTNDKKGELR